MMNIMRRFKDLGIKGTMARWYDRNTRTHRLDEIKGYAKEVAVHVRNGNSVLEIAPGPGYLSIELAKLGKYKITGLDISEDFVEIARKNAKEAGVDVEFRQGNASNIPFHDNSFNFIICTAAFKNFKEPTKALNEMRRVLKVGGTALIVDLDRDVSNRQLNAFTESIGVKGLEALFMKFTFKYFLKKGAYTKDGFISMISRTPFNRYDIREQGITLYVYLQKQFLTVN